MADTHGLLRPEALAYFGAGLALVLSGRGRAMLLASGVRDVIHAG